MQLNVVNKIEDEMFVLVYTNTSKPKQTADSKKSFADKHVIFAH